MKKLICILLSAVLLLCCSCGDENEQNNSAAAEELNSAVALANSETRFSGNYVLELSFGEGAVLYYANGDIAWDRSEKKASAVFTQTYLGVSVEMENYYFNGVMTSIEDGEALESENTAEDLFSKFPYFALPDYSDSCADLTVGNNSVGTAYTFYRNDTAAVCESIVGGDIYELVTVLKKPQTDKTQYGKTKCVYAVKDGKIVSCRYEFDIKLFDTPAYIPGHSQAEEEYTIDLHVTAKLTYEQFGGSVEVSEYVSD